MKDRIKYYFGITIAFLSITGIVIGTSTLLSYSVHAADNAVAKKAMAYGLYECYTNGNIIKNIPLTDYDGLNSITDYGNNIVLPTDYFEIASVNCGHLIGGNPFNNFSGLAATSGVTIPEDNSNTSAVSTFLQGMGYTKKEADGGKCASYSYIYEDGSATVTLKMCASVDKDNHITSERVDVSGDTTAFEIEVQDKAVQLDCSQLSGYGGCQKHTFTPGQTDFDAFAGELLGDLKAHRSEAVCLAWWCPWKLINSVDIESRGDVLATFSFNNSSTAGKQAIKYLAGYNSLDAVKLTETERIGLLQGYLNDFYKIENYGCDLDSSQQTIAKNAGYAPISTNMFSGSGYQTCWIMPTKNKNSTVAGYNSQKYFDGTPMSYDDIIAALGGSVDDLLEADKQRCNDAAESSRRAAQNLLNQSTTSEEYRKKARKTIDELDKIKSDYGEYWKEENGVIVCYPYTDVDGQTVTPPTVSPNPPDSSTPGASANPTSDIAQCLNNASSLGWILCPVLKFVGVAADGLWNEVANNWLVTDYTTYKADKNNSVYVAWSNIRNLTNIVFAIMLGIIIVSQLTGVGISNYGIKKILPTLVMTIVLVNISFLICQLLIDVSNVIGGSVESIADTMRQQISEASGVGFGDIFRGTLGSLFNIAGIGILSGAAFYTISTEGAAVLIPLLIAVIGVIISIIFAFVILAVRQAIILVSVVISPLAIICYALPNTKSLYDKWRKIFTTSLFIYPVCAVCIYGGQVVSSLMLASNHTGFMYNLVAMLLQIVPIFFIPSLIRGAMALAGNIGNRVAQMGNNLRNSATGSLSKSDTAERLRMEGQYQAAQRNRGLFDRLSQRKGLLGAIGRAGGRKLDSNIGKYNEMRLKDYQSQLYASNPRSLTTALSAAKQNHIDKLAKDIALENTDIATNDGALQVKHAEALAAYNANQTEENLASVQAYQDMLIESGDGGRQLMFDNYARAAQSGLGTALRDGAKHAIRAHSKDIKSNNRDMYAMLTQYAGGGDLMAGSFRPYLDAKGSEHMISSHFANKGIESYDAQSLAKMDEGSLDRLVEQARHNDLNTVAVGKLESLTHEAITNKTISIQGKIEDKLNDLREAMGYARISRRKSDDSGTINVHSGDSGTVLRTGNDDRPTSPASTAPTTAIPGYREAQNWRPNADAKGIITPPGFKK